MMRRAGLVLYSLVATLLSLWMALHGTSFGQPIESYAGPETVVLLHLHRGERLWDLLTGEPGLQALWADPDFQRQTEAWDPGDGVRALLWPVPGEAAGHSWGQILSQARQRWAEFPLASSLLSLDRRGLDALLGGEIGVAIQQPLVRRGAARGGPGSDTREAWPILVFVRLDSGRGTLLRLAARFWARRGSLRWYDLGGGLVALGYQGAVPWAEPDRAVGTSAAGRAGSSYPGRPQAGAVPGPGAGCGSDCWATLRIRCGRPLPVAGGPAPPPGPVALAPAVRTLLGLGYPGVGGLADPPPQLDQLTEKDEAVLAALQTQIGKVLAPGPGDLLGLAGRPVEALVQIRFAGEGCLRVGGRYEGAGAWGGTVPRFLEAGAAEGGELPLELDLPLDLRALFLWDLNGQLRSPRNRSRWRGRFSRLREEEVDLERDLWPALGSIVRLRIVPPPENSVTRQGLVLCAFPFRATAQSLKALEALMRVRWKGLYEEKAPKGAERPYVIRSEAGGVRRYHLVQGDFTRPLWLVTEREITFISDAVPFGLVLGLGADPEPAGGRPPGQEGAVGAAQGLRARWDGRQLAPHAAALTKLFLEGLRNELGAAEFMERYPDEGALVRLVGFAVGSSGLWTLRAESAPQGGAGGAVGLSIADRPVGVGGAGPAGSGAELHGGVVWGGWQRQGGGAPRGQAAEGGALKQGGRRSFGIPRAGGFRG